jgi:hypothetical protein
MKNIKKIADEIEDKNKEKDWFGPTGECWCEKLKKMIDPSTCPKGCPECEPIRSQETKQFRYLHLHDDFKSY